MRANSWRLKLRRFKLPPLTSVAWAFALGLTLHLVAAWNSVGYHHADEHWQVLEFASYKMGFTPAKDLPWEFEARIRPWMQPGLNVVIYRAAQFLGFGSFAQMTFAARLFMALLGFSSVVTLLVAMRPELMRAGAWPGGWKLAVWLSMIFWMHPWFHARTSSEGFSAAFLLFAVAALLRFRPLLAGLCLGMAFQARYLLVIQVFAVLGVVWWGAANWELPGGSSGGARARLRFSLWGVLGFSLLLLVGAIVDRWGYGEWVFAGWRYVVVNGLQGKSHQFGVFPWWDYLIAALVKMPPVLGAFSLTVLFTFWLAFWKRRVVAGVPGAGFVPHWLTWMTVPFVLAHLYFAHKEFRFMYPLGSFLPLMLALWVQRLMPAWLKWSADRAGWRRLARGVVGGLLVLNCCYLLFGAFAAERNPFRFQMEIARRFPRGITLYSDSGADIYDDCILPIHWGVPPDYRFVRSMKSAEVKRLVARGQARRASSGRPDPVWFFTERLRAETDIRGTIEAHCTRVYSVIPEWLTRLNFGGWAERVRAWSLWKCDR